MMSIRPAYLFAMTFLVIFIWQGTLWQFVSLGDHFGWMRRIQDLSQLHLEIFREPTFANPDAAMLTVGALAHHFGASLPGSLRGSTALLNALMIATCVTLAFLIYPTSSWWLGAGLFLMFEDAYFESTPHDAILAPAITALILLALYMYEQVIVTNYSLIIFGLISGLALATFLPLSPLMIGPIIVFLCLTKKISRRQLSLLASTTILSLLIFDPLLWLMPIAHLQAIRGQLIIHSLDFPNTPLPWLGFFTVAPFALLSFSLAVLNLRYYRRLAPRIPYPFLAFLLIFTVWVVLWLLSAKYKTFRSYHSLFFIWDALLPLFILDMITHSRYSPRLQKVLLVLIFIAPLLRFLIGYLKYVPPATSL